MVDGTSQMFKNSQEFSARPESDQYTHVCRLCWPKGKGEGSQASATNTGDEAPLPEASGLGFPGGYL